MKLLSTIRKFLWGNNEYTPLNRSEYLKAFVPLFLFRGVAVSVLGYPLIYFSEMPPSSDQTRPVFLAILLLVSSFFCLPYFKTIYRRFLFFDVSEPKLLTFLIFIFIFAFYYLIPDESLWYWDIIATGVLFIIYYALAYIYD